MPASGPQNCVTLLSTRKNRILDKTLGNGDSAVKMINELHAQGYQVEVRVMATHRLESELGMEQRFMRDIDRKGSGRYVPQGVQSQVYDSLFESLDKIRAATDAPISIFNRDGQQLYDSRVDTRSPGDVLLMARDSELPTLRWLAR